MLVSDVNEMQGIVEKYKQFTLFRVFVLKTRYLKFMPISCMFNAYIYLIIGIPKEEMV